MWQERAQKELALPQAWNVSPSGRCAAAPDFQRMLSIHGHYMYYNIQQLLHHVCVFACSREHWVWGALASLAYALVYLAWNYMWCVHVLVSVCFSPECDGLICLSAQVWN
jgi:hypothetical protein